MSDPRNRVRQKIVELRERAARLQGAIDALSLETLTPDPDPLTGEPPPPNTALDRMLEEKTRLDLAVSDLEVWLDGNS